MKPRLAFVPGDPSGIGPELIAKLIHANIDDLPADILLVGDKHLWDQGAKQANLDLSINTIIEGEVPRFEGIAHLDLDTIDQNAIKTADTLEGLAKCLGIPSEAFAHTVQGLPWGATGSVWSHLWRHATHRPVLWCESDGCTLSHARRPCYQYTGTSCAQGRHCYRKPLCRRRCGLWCFWTKR